MSERLQGQRALITGAASGIGRAIAETYASEGARLALLDVQADALEAVADDVDAETVSAECDVRSTEQVTAAVEKALDAFDGLDAVVNNAGVIENRSVVDVTDDELDWMVEVNLKGAIRVARATIPALRAGGGTMVNLASALALGGSSGRSVYSATKGGIVSMTRQLAVEYGPDGVRVNAIAPGSTITPMTAEMRAANPDFEAERSRDIPLGRLGRPEDVADVALFLASGESRYVTGHVVPVDGGKHATA